ncbi:MAG TPA: PEGA domain-containing protein [Vicinamibacterales bacterium]|jgi:hypothetical protein
MSRFLRFHVCALLALMLLATLPGLADAQRRVVPRPPSPSEPAVVVSGHVFIGGYFYNPMFGPYPWWPQGVYPSWYYPTFDRRAEVRLRINPKEADNAAVYVDGFYAGIVDDFNNVFQSLPLTPGGHTIVLYLEGYRTLNRNIYLSPGSMFELRQMMERLPAGATSERPEVAPAIPAPPTGTYRAPITPAPLPPSSVPPHSAPAASLATLELRIEPADAEVTIDGRPWITSEEGHFIVQVPAGAHRIEVAKPGYWQFAARFELREGQSNTLNVRLTADDEK